MDKKLCNCMEEAKLLEVKKEGANKGRKFWACAKPKAEQCDYFEWADGQGNKERPIPKQPYQPRPLKTDPIKDDAYWAKIRAENAEGQSLGNAKNCAAMLLSAAIQKGELNLTDALSKFDEVVQWVYDVGNEKTS